MVDKISPPWSDWVAVLHRGFAVRGAGLYVVGSGRVGSGWGGPCKLHPCRTLLERIDVRR